MGSVELDMAKASFAERPFSFFRSERMAKISVTLPLNDRALQIATIRQLGQSEICQFTDVSSLPPPLSPVRPVCAALTFLADRCKASTSL